MFFWRVAQQRAESIAMLMLCGIAGAHCSSNSTVTPLPGASTAADAGGRNVDGGSDGSDEGETPTPTHGIVDESFGTQGVKGLLVVDGTSTRDAMATHSMIARADGTVSVFASLTPPDEPDEIRRYDVTADGTPKKPQLIGSALTQGILARPGGYLSLSFEGCTYLTERGAIDTSAPNGGQVKSNVYSTSSNYAFALNDGSFFASTSCSMKAAGCVGRFTPACAPDNNWGEYGVETAGDGIDTVGVVADAQGVLYQSGVAADASGDQRWRVVRREPAGALDAAFSVEGALRHKVVVSNPVLDAQGRVLVATAEGEPMQIQLRRIVEGKLDASFGKAKAQADDSPRALRLLRGEDDSLYVVVDTAASPMVLAFSETGALSSNFGTKGRGLLGPLVGYTGVTQVELAPPGKITMLLEMSRPNSRAGFGVLRLVR